MQTESINKTLRSELARSAVVVLVTWGLTLPSLATTPLGDIPALADVRLPGNVALALSVEWPTVSRAAYATGVYSSGGTYRGYFDPDKCYDYRFAATDADTTAATPISSASAVRHFAPAGLASNRRCVSKWSGNFLNWATGQAIDPFRWAMTGGNRVVDTVTETVIQKAWHSGQGGLFPDKSLPANEIAGATPFISGNQFNTRIQGGGFGMRFSVGDLGGGFVGRYYNLATTTGTVVVPDASTNPTWTDAQSTINYNWAASPGGTVNADNFVVVWTGTLRAPTAGQYRFQTETDDGVRLYINNNLVIDRWVDQAPTFQQSNNITFAAGQAISVRFEYYERGGGAVARLFWRRPGDSNYALADAGLAGTAPGNLAAATFTDYNPANAVTTGTVYDVKIRAKVCDPSAGAGGVESNCRRYGSNWKPEGLVQQYSNRMRFSAFGYLNHESNNRDGGVMRASQKFVGPTQPVPGSTDITNGQAEWSATTGQMQTNPNPDDINTTAANFSAHGVTSADIRYSGVMNYLNKFGQIYTGNYKGLDPVSEMYYAALRYLRGMDNVPEYSNPISDPTDAPSVAQMRRRVDGFPVITDWQQNNSNRGYRAVPIQYSCQRNFILGIGDIYTHRDKNLPGNLGGSRFGLEEPALPASVASDTAVDAIRAANKVGELEGLGASVASSNNYSGRNNSLGIAGLAYWANTSDIRPDMTNGVNNNRPQTVQTYWVDVLEGAGDASVPGNQFRLAAKYGGFVVPEGFSLYGRTAALERDWWANDEEFVGGSTSVLRPRNYFTAGDPNQMIVGLQSAFAKISSDIDAFTTSFSTSLPQLARSGNTSFSSEFDSESWTSSLVGSELSFDIGTNQVTRAQVWNASDLLNTMVDDGGWDTRRKVITFDGNAGIPFRLGSLASAQQALLDSPVRAGNDAGDVVRYLRGDRRLEVNPTATTVDPTKFYRSRRFKGVDRLLGDIVGSKLVPVPAPNFPFSDATNPGYSAFKAAYAARRTVVYAGANDGMLHAFDGSANAASGGGKELFAYIPSGVYAGPTNTPTTNGLVALVNPQRSHYYYVNATPHYADVDFSNVKTRTQPQSGAQRGELPNWKTLLIGGLGKGGRSYYALDITDTNAMVTQNESAMAGRVLWEFSHPLMGHSFGEPVVTKTKKYGWTVIFVSGYNNVDGQGYFFLVDPRNGNLLEPPISTEAGTATAQSGLASVKAAIPDFTDNTADAAYAGDLLGNLWRLDLTQTNIDANSHLNPSGNPAQTTPVAFAIATDDNGAGQPITTRAVIEPPRGSNERWVAFGAGRLLDTSDINDAQQQSFYAVRDGVAAGFSTTANSGVTFPIRRADLIENPNALNGIEVPNDKRGWHLDLEVVTVDATISRGYRVIADPDAFDGLVAFAEMVPVSADPCAPSGNSRVYSVDIRTGKSSLTRETVTNGVATQEPISSLNIAGTVTDLRFVSIDGNARLMSGNDRGEVTLTNPNRAGSSGLRRLNWREIPLNN
jgi:type IV pilus assembly protein PilY1